MTPDRFASIDEHGFIRLAVATPNASVGDVGGNSNAILDLARKAALAGADIVLFPELCLSSYAIDDLHLQDALLDRVETEIGKLIEASLDLPVLLVGAPVRRAGRLYNAALAIGRGKLLGVVPKSYLPNYREYYEKRWFASGAGLTDLDIELAGCQALCQGSLGKH